MLTSDRLPVSRVRENSTHGLKGGLDGPSYWKQRNGK